MKYLLDTNAVSALMRADARLIERLSATEKVDVGVPQPVLAEIEYGLARLRRSRRRERLHAQFERIGRELPRVVWTDDVSVHFGAIKAELERLGTPIEDFDVAIAAHALAHGATLVTANLSHMARVPGLVVEDWS